MVQELWGGAAALNSSDWMNRNLQLQNIVFMYEFGLVVLISEHITGKQVQKKLKKLTVFKMSNYCIEYVRRLLLGMIFGAVSPKSHC